VWIAKRSHDQHDAQLASESKNAIAHHQVKEVMGQRGRSYLAQLDKPIPIVKCVAQQKT